MRDALRWRALIESPGVRLIGGARFHQPGWLIGVEFYDEYPSGAAKAEAVQILTEYADMRVRENYVPR